jgi:hypothetical protein
MSHTRTCAWLIFILSFFACGPSRPARDPDFEAKQRAKRIQHGVSAFMPLYGSEEEERGIEATIGRDKFVVPLNWIRVNFAYEVLKDSVPVTAAQIFQSAFAFNGDTIRILDSTNQIRFTDEGLSRFFAEHKPVFLDRLVKLRSYDTVRTDRRGKTIHLHDMSTTYLIMLSGTSREEAMETLKLIPGVVRVRRYEHWDFVPMQEQ